MRVDNGDGTYTAGPLDVVLILYRTSTDTYHICWCREAPLPGMGGVSGDIVRLKSGGHHTDGAATLDGAKAHLQEFLAMVRHDPLNVCEVPLEWDGEVFVQIVSNWRKPGAERPFAEALGALI